MDLKNIKKHSNWVKMWSAKGSFYFDSHLGQVWTRRKNIAGKAVYNQAILFYKKGITDCWATKSDRDDFGGRLNSLACQNPSYITSITNQLISHTKKVSQFIASHDAKKINPIEFNQFWRLVYDYYLYHLSVKYVADYLSEKELKKVLPVLRKAMLFAEPTFRNIENYIELIAKQIARGTSYTKEMIMSATKEELEVYFKNGKLPPATRLQNRYNKSVIIFNKKESEIITGKNIVEIEKIVFPKKSTDIINGQTAYRGKIRGRIRIVLNPAKLKSVFKKGEILVTGMTRPEFLPLLKKASGFITDSGGVLSHAAIIARELHKPCIIGTKIATKALKDGDMVELDANKVKITILK